MSEKSDEETGRFAFGGLDRVLHEKARLGILTSLLAHHRGLSFNELRDHCSLTDGNLSRHLQMLNEAGLVQIWKGFKDNRPQTLCMLTELGRKRFIEYITVLENIVTDAVGAEKPIEEPKLSKGWSPA